MKRFKIFLVLILILSISGCAQQPTGSSLEVNSQQNASSAVNQQPSQAPNPCANVICSDKCSGNNRLINGHCVGGQCEYFSDYCETGCTDGRCNPLPAENIKSNALNISYDSLMRNTNSYIGKIVYFRGEVTQVLEVYGNSYGLRVYVTKAPYWSDDVYVNYEGKRLLENDIIDLWGRLKGLTTYKTVLGKDVTVPEIDSIEAEFVTKECSHGFIYNGNECVECGSEDQPCCDNSKCTLSIYTACINNKCVKCGGLKEPCCSDGICSFGMLGCIDNVCDYCGRENERCCDNNKCSTGSICRNGLCEECGSTGEQCCGHDSYYNCFIGSCQSGVCVYP